MRPSQWTKHIYLDLLRQTPNESSMSKGNIMGPRFHGLIDITRSSVRMVQFGDEVLGRTDPDLLPGSSAAVVTCNSDDE